jgi:SAM-dependent methyltransferase
MKGDELFRTYAQTAFRTMHEGRDFDLTARGYGEWFHDCLPGDRSAPMLDIGCGNGVFLRFLELSGYHKIEGIEVSESQVLDARTRLRCPVHLADAETWIASHPAAYARIFVNDVLEHIPEDRVLAFLQTIARGLAAGGAVVISAPQAAGLTSIHARYVDFTHRRLFTEYSLQQVLLMAGFTQVRFLGQRLPWKYTPRHLAYRFLRACYVQALRLAYAIEQPGERPPAHFHQRIYAEARLAAGER